MMKKIKIALVITRLDWGGVPDIIRIICNNLNPAIYDLRLITGPTKYPSVKTKEFLNKLNGRLIILSNLQRNINPLKDSLTLINLYRLFRREKFGLVHTHTSKAGILGRIAAKAAGVPKVAHTFHGHTFYGYFGIWMSKIVVATERFAAGFADKITVLTELEKEDLIKFKIAPPAKIAVINSGLELDIYKEVNIDVASKKKALQIEPEVLVVGMIGRLEPVKGPEYFIEAAKFISERFSKVKFLVVGEGSLRNKLEDSCKKLNISEKFIFTGWREDVAEILPILDVLVLPSLNEAVGRILIEAGACGVAAVATRVGGVAEIVKDGETGILVAPKDAYSLAKAVISLLEDEGKRLKMKEAAKKWIDDKFSASKMAKRFSDLYEELLKDGKNR